MPGSMCSHQWVPNSLHLEQRNNVPWSTVACFVKLRPLTFFAQQIEELPTFALLLAVSRRESLKTKIMSEALYHVLSPKTWPTMLMGLLKMWC